MNKVVLTGNLCKNHDVRVTESGKKVIRNSIAVKRKFKNAQGNYESDFINIVYFCQSINYMEQYTKKGDKVSVVGRWQHRTYQDQYGNNKYVDECVVDEIELLSRPQKTESASIEPAPTEQSNNDNPWGVETIDIDDDLPF